MINDEIKQGPTKKKNALLDPSSIYEKQDDDISESPIVSWIVERVTNMLQTHPEKETFILEKIKKIANEIKQEIGGHKLFKGESTI